MQIPLNATLDWAERRVFVTPVPGCPAKCSFCYLESVNLAKPGQVSISSRRLCDQITNDSRFIPGDSGTVISFGCLSETLAPHSIDATTALLNELPTSNPIQIATRWAVTGEALSSFLQVALERQVVLFHSFSTLKEVRTFETGTPSLGQRFQFIDACRAAGLAAVLYIKPFIPRVTTNSIDGFLQLARNLECKDVVVGPLFLDNVIESRLSSKVPSETLQAAFRSEYFPVGTATAGDINQIDSELQEFITAFRDAEFSVSFHGSDVLKDVRSSFYALG